MNKRACDWVLVAVIVVLVLFGFLMVYSSSYPDGYYKYGDPFMFLRKQITAAILGIVCMIVFSFLNYRWYRRFNKAILAGCIGFSLLTVFLGFAGGGAQRWVQVMGSYALQPSEVIKLGAIIYMADFFDRRRSRIGEFKEGFVASMVAIAFFCGLIAIQDDLSTAIILGLTLGIMMFCSGVKIRYLVMLFSVGVVGIAAMIIMEPYRMQRVVAFTDPFKYVKDWGWQPVQSLYALGTGGLFGMGIGKSRQKFFYLPEPYNDFIFSIIGEELGFIGCVIVILVFVIFAWRGLRIAMNSRDFYGSQMALGITAIVLVQFLIHIAVGTSSMPTTGRALPFISAGGSSLLFLLISMGILLNISRFSDTYRS